MRKTGARLLLTALLSLLPAAARAALDLATLDLLVEIEATAGVDSGFQVTLTVTGTDLATASITPQGGVALPLPCSTALSCSATQTLANQGALDALLPTTARSFTLAVTGTTQGETVTDTFSFARPVVPSPAISAPLAGATVPAGALQVVFSACGNSCTATTHAALEKGGVLEEEADLTATSTSWQPATALVAESSFSAEITHRTGGLQNLTADGIGTGTDDDAYGFGSSVTHSDRVAFTTGFAAPVGDFCIVVNDDAADLIDPTDCALVVEPAAGILDTSDSCTATAAGIAIQYGFQLAANGRLSGIADADLDGDASFETHAVLGGRLRGEEGLLRQKLRVRFADAVSATRLRFRVEELADLATLQGPVVPPLEWLTEQTLRGKLAGVKQDESTTSLRHLPAQPGDGIQCAGGVARTGWKLSFSLTGSDGPTSGNLELANGVSVALVARQRFDFLTNQTRLRLESRGAERGVQIMVRRLGIDETQPAKADQITAGVVHFHGFGQGGRVLLP